MRKGIIFGLLIVCVGVILAAGCASVVGNTPEYQAGDIIAVNYTVPVGIIILSYNQSDNMYTDRLVLQKTNGSWGYYATQYGPQTDNRTAIEANFTVIDTHIPDPASITIIDENNPPGDIKLFKEDGVYSQNTDIALTSNSSQMPVPVPTLSATCYDLNAASKMDGPFLNFLNNSNITSGAVALTTPNGCNLVAAEQVNQWIDNSPLPITPDLVQEREYLQLATTFCQTTTPLTAAPNRTLEILMKFNDTLQEYENSVMACHSQFGGEAASQTPQVSNEGTSFNGSGDYVQPFTTVGAEIHIFNISYYGDNNFTIWLKDEQGNNIDLLINETGSYNGMIPVQLGPGIYYLDITASGPWSVDLSLPPLQTPTAVLIPNALPLNVYATYGSGDEQGEATVYRYEVRPNYNWTSPSGNSANEVAEAVGSSGATGPENGYYTARPEDGDIFLFVYVRVRNTGSGEVYVPSAKQFVVFSNGNTYNYTSTHSSDVVINSISGTQYDYQFGPGGTSGYVQPGESNAIDGYLIYDIPASFSPNSTYVVSSLEYQSQAAWVLG